MDPIIDILNKFIKVNLPAINSEIQKTIKQQNLDPKADVVSGDKVLGSIDLGFDKAYVKASYKISDLKGLSTLSISRFEIVSVDQNPNDSDSVSGKVQIEVKLGSDIQANMGGSVSAGCGPIHPDIGLSGTVKAPNVTANSTGSLNAGINGVKLCVSSFDMVEFSVSYGHPDVYIDDLGMFNNFMEPLEDAIITLFNGDLKSMITSVIRSSVKEQVDKYLPLCVGLPL